MTGPEPVEWCAVCDAYYSDSRIDVRRHVMQDHTLDERLDALHEAGPPPEDTHGIFGGVCHRDV